MAKLLPHQEKKYGLPTIVLVAIFAFIFLFFVTTILTWHINTKWEATSNHAKAFTRIIKDEFNERKHGYLKDYKYYLKTNGFEDDFIYHLIFQLLLSLVVSCMFAILLYKNRLTEKLKHIEGPKLYFYKEAIKHANKMLKKEIKYSGIGLNIHPDIILPLSRESGNFFVSGVHGSGKSVFLKQLLIQIIRRKTLLFIYDEKKEYTEVLFNKYCVLLAPWDKRTYQWDIQKDSFNDAMATLIAEMLFPTEEKDTVWSDGSRLIFVAITIILNATRKRWGWKDVANLLTLDEQSFCTLLEKYDPKVSRFIEEKSKTTTSFYIKLISRLGWIFHLAKAWPNPDNRSFSVHEWINQSNSKQRRVIVQADKRFKGLGANLANAIISLMSAHILALPDSIKREFWLFLDELGNLPKNESLIEWMSLGRSKGCRTLAGTQSISQLQGIYGNNGADSLLNLFTIFVAMRAGSAGSTAKYTSEIFGERTIERPVYDPKSKTYTWLQEKKPLVSHEDLVHLPYADKEGVEGYLLLPSLYAIYRLKWTFRNWKKIAQAHVPAKWVTSKPSVINQKTKPQKPQKPQKPKTSISKRDQLIQRRRHAIHKQN